MQLLVGAEILVALCYVPTTRLRLLPLRQHANSLALDQAHEPQEQHVSEVASCKCWPF